MDQTQKPTAPLAPTLGKTWRMKREQGVIVHLPSGNLARVRSVNFETLVRLGRVPDMLAGVVASALTGGRGKIDIATLQQLNDWVSLLEAVTASSFIEPKVVADPQADDEIGIDDVPTEDKLFVLQLVNAPVAELESFRYQPQSDVDDLDAQQGVERAAESGDEDSSVVQG